MSTTNLPFYIVLIGAIALVGFLIMQEPDDAIASEYPIPAGNDYARDAGNPASGSRLLTSDSSSDLSGSIFKCQFRLCRQWLR